MSSRENYKSLKENSGEWINVVFNRREKAEIPPSFETTNKCNRRTYKCIRIFHFAKEGTQSPSVAPTFQNSSCPYRLRISYKPPPFQCLLRLKVPLNYPPSQTIHLPSFIVHFEIADERV